MTEIDILVKSLIDVHENGKCTCEEFSETHDTRMCDAYAYITGNISKEELLECIV